MVVLNPEITLFRGPGSTLFQQFPRPGHCFATYSDFFLDYRTDLMLRYCRPESEWSWAVFLTKRR